MTKYIQLDGIGELKLNAERAAYRVLLFDDDKQWVAATVKALEARGIDEVEGLVDIEKATEAVRHRRFDAVLFDIKINARGQNGEEIQGDDWASENRKYFRDAIAASITAYPGKIRNRPALQRNGVKVIVKSADEENQFYDELGHRSAEKATSLKKKLTSAVQLALGEIGEPVEGELDPRIVGAMRDMFINWLNTRERHDSVGILLRGEHYNLERLIEEVRGATVLGNDILGMFLRHIELRIAGKVPPLPSRE